jgi:hypothetical protein
MRSGNACRIALHRSFEVVLHVGATTRYPVDGTVERVA